MVYINIVAYLPWFIVVVLMLKIFLKYAKPSKDEMDDDEQRIKEALLDRFEDKTSEYQTEEEKFKRRQKAYKEMADL